MTFTELPSHLRDRCIKHRLLNSISFDYEKVLAEVDELERKGLYRQSLITQWIAIESLCKDLSVFFKTITNSTELWLKQKRKLSVKSNPVDLDKNNLEVQLFDLIYTHNKELLETGYRYIVCDDVLKAMRYLEVPHTDSDIRFLLASKVTTKPSDDLPSKTTIRAVLNNIIHNGGKLEQAYYAQLKSYFDGFFGSIRHLKEQTL